MNPMLDIPQPKLARLEHGLSSAERRTRWKRWQREGYDGIEVNIFGGAFGPTWPQGKTHSLDFLADFPGLKGLSVVVSGIESLEPLSLVAESLESLNVGGWMDQSKLSCRPIAACRQLRSLSLCRLPKDLVAIETLTGLKRLSLLGFAFQSLDVVRPLRNLETLWIGFGTLPEIDPVGELRRLKALEILRVGKLTDLSPLSRATALQFLALGDMKQITTMPDCAALKKLRRVYLDTMNGVTDLGGLADAPKLEELVVANSKIDPGVFDPIIARPRPRRVTVGLASRKATESVEARLGKRAVSVFGTPDERIRLK